MLKTQVMGNVGKDAEVKQIGNNGRAVVNFSVAHTEKYTKDDVKQERTIWVDCAWYFENAERANKIAQYIKKGSKIYVDGRPETRAWINTQSNTAQSVLVLNVLNLEFASSKPEGSAPAATGTQAAPQQGNQSTQQPNQSSSTYQNPVAGNNQGADDDDLPF